MVDILSKYPLLFSYVGAISLLILGSIVTAAITTQISDLEDIVAQQEIEIENKDRPTPVPPPPSPTIPSDTTNGLTESHVIELIQRVTEEDEEQEDIIIEGTEGPVGPQGDQGPRGIQGEQGEQGEPPYSWRFSLLDVTITCERVDNFDRNSPRYECTGPLNQILSGVLISE